ncbi:AAA family ATPase [Nannocystis pusilla]|uniref:MoxR family ATPase n=1 Tax=Nannocystis pusilla TaxID=889268 RepID=A0ABS7TN43_9BACT|nr:MoxR family ATPase [Nannocystis pusilla]MBZ5709615.1 MoxR family ATPase [Nannocystis pusilla]
MTQRIFTGTGSATSRAPELPPPPPWRDLKNWRRHRASTWKPTANELDLINAAIVLRLPLLVNGPPGSGKTSIAYAIAAELGWGEVLTWNINSRVARSDGLYHYDAAGRLRDVALAQQNRPGGDEDIGQYLRLGPLGTALATSKPDRPRVLLVDEIDKADIDFPNDLLDLLDEGRFEIPELGRIVSSHPKVDVRTACPNETVTIAAGSVQAEAFPFVVLTSNGERDFPPAFLRRCLRLETKIPERARLQEILGAHLSSDGAAWPVEVQEVLDRFSADAGAQRKVAVDQLLNAVFLIAHGALPDEETRRRVLDAVLRELEDP